MSTDEICLPVQIIDGQEVYIPDDKAWETLFQTRVFQGRTIFSEDMRDLVRIHLDLSHRYPVFALAFHALPALRESWLILMLLQTPSGSQRVHIEHLKCDVCGWYGPTANPMVSDLYIGVPDSLNVMRSAERHLLLPCPKCASKLPRHPIWTEPWPRPV